MAEGSFQKLSERFYKSSPWPSVEMIADVVDQDHVFCLLYKVRCARGGYFAARPAASTWGRCVNAWANPHACMRLPSWFRPHDARACISPPTPPLIHHASHPRASFPENISSPPLTLSLYLRRCTTATCTRAARRTCASAATLGRTTASCSGCCCRARSTCCCPTSGCGT